MNKPSSSSSILSRRLGGLRLSGSAALRGCSRNVAWRPILLGVTVKQVMGLPALLETPLKGPYIRRDAERCARFYSLSWRPPTPMTFSSVAAARAVFWAVAQRALVKVLRFETPGHFYGASK